MNTLQISSFYMPEPKIMSLWCMVPEILCTMDQWMDRQTNRQKKWHSRHKQTQALTISFSNMVKHSNSYIKCRVWPNGSCFVIHDEVLNFHDWIICYHELFHNKIKKRQLVELLMDLGQIRKLTLNYVNCVPFSCVDSFHLFTIKSTNFKKSYS